MVTIGRVNESSPSLAWPEAMLAPYGEMLTVNDVAVVLNVDVRNARGLLTTADASRRIPAVKIGKSWRIARSQLTSYLVEHQNQPHDTTNERAAS